MAAGLATVADRHGVSTEGDFRAHLFVLESV
jgi:hypothetical protein